MYDELKEAGLSNVDIEMLKSIDENVMKIESIARLIIKSHNYGFKKGVNESIKFMECEQKGLEY